MANPFAEGAELTHWFHPLCAAYKRPEAMLEGLAQSPASVPGREALERATRASMAAHRLPRIDGAERARGNARCRSCQEPISRGSWRIRLVFFEEGRFHPAGFVHLACGPAYFGSEDILDRLLHFSPGLGEDERAELCALWGARTVGG